MKHADEAHLQPLMLNFLVLKVRVALLLAATFVAAQNTPRPDVPEKIRVPENEQVILQLHAAGSQIYTCQMIVGGPYIWSLKAPEAELQDASGASVGMHFAGPTWKYKDGSEVMGKIAAKIDAPDPDAVPWLLLSAVNHSGDGALSRVSSIQRIHTKGGQPPKDAVCNASKFNTDVKSPYSADYFFYAPSK